MTSIEKFLLVIMLCNSALAYCPLDHLFIGCNEDGIPGTADDMKLFVHSLHKYRNSENFGEWFYTLSVSGMDPHNFIINQPGFDEINDGSQYDHPLKDPNRSLSGVRNVDYQIMVQCLDISENFRVTNLTGTIVLDEPGDFFNHSAQPDTHIHLWYVWRSSQPYVQPDELLWVTYQLYDAKGKYSDSEPFSIAFVKEPLPGDLAMDGYVDVLDIERFGYYWLMQGASQNNDYYERADINKDGSVDFYDFAMLAQNWMTIAN